MEAIDQELEAKSIERDEINIGDSNIKEIDAPVASEAVEEPVPTKPKVKKPRSEKQIAAFERAKQKRAESIALKKQQKEEEKIQKKEQKKELKSIAKEPEPEPEPIIKEAPTRASTMRASEQIVNNYYYYGTGPPQPQQEAKRKKTRKARAPTPPSSSESESESETESEPDEPATYKKLQNYSPSEEKKNYQPPKSSLKFRFA